MVCGTHCSRTCVVHSVHYCVWCTHGVYTWYCQLVPTSRCVFTCVRAQLLSTRVLTAAEQDQVKLDRVLHYLSYTRSLGLVLPASKPAEILAHTSAACGAHRGRKSHTGAVASLGSGPTYSSSTSQSINTTSSSESELVGLPGNVEPALLTRISLTEQGYSATETAVLQDNTSTVSLVSSGADS